MRFLYDINEEGLCRRQSAVRHFTGKMPNDNDRSGKGRCVVATRDIDPLELILSDSPVVIGPSRQRRLVCVECFKDVDGSVRCPKCNFPICNYQCPEEERDGKWHSDYECPFLSSVGFRAADGDLSAAADVIPELQVQMACITPLRLILRAKRGLECSRDLLPEGVYDFYSDPVPISAGSRHAQFEKAMSEVLLNEMNIESALSSTNELSTESLVFTVLRQLFNNAKSLEKVGNESSGLYAGYALLNHACVANAKVVVGKNYYLEVRAQSFIPAGEEITTRYIGVNTGSPVRSEIIQQHWGFTCLCSRCCDPSEGGTYSSAILCRSCQTFKEEAGQPRGLILPQQPEESSVPAAAAESWQCNGCQKVVSKEFVRRIIDAGLRVIKNNSTIPPDVVLLEQVVLDLMTIYHPKHYLIIQVKFVLVRVLSKETSSVKGTEDSEDSEVLASIAKSRRLISLCNEILEVLDVLDPGMSPNRGRILKILISPIMAVSNHELKTQVIDQTEFKLRKMYCSKLAKDLVHCYKYEFI